MGEDLDLGEETNMIKIYLSFKIILNKNHN